MLVPILARASGGIGRKYQAGALAQRAHDVPQNRVATGLGQLVVEGAIQAHQIVHVARPGGLIAAFQHRAQFGNDRGIAMACGEARIEAFEGGAHAGAYACDPAARLAAGPGIAGLVLISSRLRADALPGNQNAKAVRAYYGDDESLYEARSVTTHANLLDVPVFLTAAEFDNTYLDAYTAEFAWRVGMARGRMPRFMHMTRHNHTSIVAHFDSGEDVLGRKLLEFVSDPRQAIVAAPRRVAGVAEYRASGIASALAAPPPAWKDGARSRRTLAGCCSVR